MVKGWADTLGPVIWALGASRLITMKGDLSGPSQGEIMVKPSAKRWPPRPVYVFRGQRLRIIRENLQLTLSQVAHLTGIATSSLSDYEGGKIVPQVHQLKKLCFRTLLTRLIP